MTFLNSYEDTGYAAAYAKLEFPNTYYLAFRDMPEILQKHIKGKKALDFGCGTGRSSRFLKKSGFDVIGVDISGEMIRKANQIDPDGNYLLIESDGLNQFKPNTFHLVLSCFTFDNIPTMKKKVGILKSLGKLLNEQGVLINLVSTPDIYTHEWASFSTRDFPENQYAKSGDKVRIIVTDLEDKRPAEDIIWTDKYYRKTYRKAGLVLLHIHKPLATEREPYPWINETRIPPWCIYVLKKKKPSHKS